MDLGNLVLGRSGSMKTASFFLENTKEKEYFVIILDAID